jgi:glycosyltransferase involved in cell wall biosynthesis
VAAVDAADATARLTEVSRPVRVAILVDSLLAGGAERVAVDTACHLDSQRYEPVVIVTRQSGPLARQLHLRSVHTTILDRRRGLSPGAMAQAIRVARRCDLIHAHKLAGSAWASLLARYVRRPLIAHEHTWLQRDAAGRGALYRFVIGRTATKIICVSPTIAAAVVSHGVRIDRVVTIPNGVRLDAALPRTEARAELGSTRRPTIGIVARLRPEKRHELLLEAAKTLQERALDFNICIVGGGPCLGALRAKATQLGIANRVTFAGERHDPARLVRAFDVSVICSNAEGLPLAALEAMAGGVPVVATAVGALPELLRDGAGTLVPPEDRYALADAIGALLNDAARRREIGISARKRIAERYTVERMVESIEGIYTDVLATSGARTRRA